jgi:uncharacterized protein (UPF0332 family)
MKPETSAALDEADRALAAARGNLSIDFSDQAARLAYYAQFHAAQALIFERTGKVAKSHKGVNKEFHRLALAEATFPAGIAAQLTKAYDYKQIADYGISTATPITPTQASDAIVTAERFVAVIREALTPPPAAPAP